MGTGHRLPVLTREAPRELQKVQKLLEKGVVFLVCGGLGPTFSFFFFFFFTFYVFLYDRVFSWTEVQRAEFITAIRVSFSSLAPVSPPLVLCLEFLLSGFPLLFPLTTQATFLTCPYVPVCPCARFSVQTTCRSGLRLNISVSFSFPPSAQYYNPSMVLGGPNSLSLTGAWHSVVATAHCPSDGHLSFHYYK